MSRPDKLADHVRARATEPRIERQWAAIEHAGLPGAAPARARRAPWIAGALALSAAAGALLFFVQAPASLRPGALVESAQDEIAVQLDDGSRVELSPASQLRLLENRAQAVTLELRSGKARFHVTRDRARRFRVDAGELEVRVIGTRFELTRKRKARATLVQLAVSEGVVEVRRRDVADEVRQIRAGESWSALIEDRRRPEPRAEATATAAQESDEPLAPEPGEAEAQRADEPRSAAAPERDASALFRKASLARRAGRMRDAADAYADLLARHPGDARAGLSAFELGRIRMDALDDHPGAIQALERAIAAGSSASFHEDALARIVVASDALGRGDACRRARARYLERYPQGVHRNALAARCR
jgi:transmembrane sensor